MLRGFCTADNQLAAKEFLVVQLCDRPFGFLDRLHLNERETLGALVMPVTYHLGVLDVANAIKELEKVTFRGIEGQVADVKTRRRDFDRFWFAWRPLLMCTVR